jgi:hypothetical protein
MSPQSDEPPPEAAKAVPLADAFREHADPKLLAKFRATTERLEREGKWQYIGTPRKVEGYVLSEFDGHGRELLKESRELIAKIEAGFVGKLRRGDLTAWAREGSPLAPWREIPASAWATLRLDDITKGTANGPGVALFDVRVGPRVAVIAAVPETVAVPVPTLRRTGDPGRPNKGYHLYEAEFDRRRQAGQIESSLVREAEWLLAWFKATHPDWDPPTVKTISERLRAKFREAQSKHA